jgi:hypothetical protein
VGRYFDGLLQVILLELSALYVYVSFYQDLVSYGILCRWDNLRIDIDVRTEGVRPVG